MTDENEYSEKEQLENATIDVYERKKREKFRVCAVHVK